MNKPSEQQLITAAEHISSMHADKDHTSARADTARAIAEQFLKNKYANANMSQELKSQVIQQLMQKVPEMSESRLMQLFDRLHEHDVADAVLLAGGNPQDKRSGGGGDLNVFIGGDQAQGSTGNKSLISPETAAALESIFSAVDVVISARGQNADS